jgi:hypothetical protein
VPNNNSLGVSPFTDEETALIEHLRKEANEVKDCFTKFSFQALSISAIGLSLLVRFQPEFPWLGLASIFIILLVLSVMRIGTYKYGTANRHYGYELHLDRVRRLISSKDSAWKPEYREIGWEESLRAWRIVQPSIFRHLYNWGVGEPNKLNKFAQSVGYKWFESETLLGGATGVHYHAGSYLRTMISLLSIVAGFCLISLLFTPLQLLVQEKYTQSAISIGIFAIVCYVTISRLAQIRARRKLLESGILSIHSCAIVWNLTVMAHFRAQEQLDGFNNGGVKSFQGYTLKLSEQASEILHYFSDGKTVYDWLNEPIDLGARFYSYEGQSSELDSVK